MGGSQSMQVSYVVALLTGVTRDHWDNVVNLRGGLRLGSILELEALMVERFRHTCRHTENLHKILIMRQGKRSVHEYTRNFENPYGKLLSYDSSWAQQIFMWGLGHDIAI